MREKGVRGAAEVGMGVDIRAETAADVWQVVLKQDDAVRTGCGVGADTAVG
ncbi:hypothetical protein [Streptomyces sp. TP-A0874]|uniref:hypothetical protein n=1 Tax=Streptomyces sp. TP-A0874 TaxID=549819 RepID=UPI001481C6A5|nr:hypothetical protein [Streptomyces sp. TP-A0874]